jgi:hypothetical protein
MYSLILIFPSDSVPTLFQSLLGGISNSPFLKNVISLIPKNVKGLFLNALSTNPCGVIFSYTFLSLSVPSVFLNTINFSISFATLGCTITLVSLA